MFNAIKLIFHNGNHFVAGFSVSDSTFIIIDISKIISYEITDRTFNYKDLIIRADEEIKKRFGLAQNIDSKTYDIILEISSSTGLHLKQYHWHSSQVFTKLPNGNWQLKLHCGINRELISWICMWAKDIKIINDTMINFKSLKHRQEIVTTYKNVTFINDSKATSPEATEMALKLYKNKIKK